MKSILVTAFLLPTLFFTPAVQGKVYQGKLKKTELLISGQLLTYRLYPSEGPLVTYVIDTQACICAMAFDQQQANLSGAASFDCQKLMVYPDVAPHLSACAGGASASAAPEENVDEAEENATEKQ